MNRHLRQDRISNVCIREKVMIAPIIEKMVELEHHIRLFWSCDEKTYINPSKKGRFNGG